MLRLKSSGTSLLIGVTVCLVIANYSTASAQERNAARTTTTAASTPSSDARGEDNYDVYLHLLTASSGAGAADAASVPQALDAAIKQLRSSLPYANYRLATTFINRVKDGGSTGSRGIGNFLLPTLVGPKSPTFYDFNLYQVKSERDAQGQPFIRIGRFRFDLRLPIVTGSTSTEAGHANIPVINYDSVGMNTEMSIREGVPAIVGTFATGKPDELLILLILAKRNPQR